MKKIEMGIEDVEKLKVAEVKEKEIKEKDKELEEERSELQYLLFFFFL